MREVLWRAVEHAAGNAVALLGEDFIADALLDVVSFAGENKQGFILRFPAKPGDCSVVAVRIEAAFDAVVGFRLSVGRKVRDKNVVGNRLDQTSTEHRRWD